MAELCEWILRTYSREAILRGGQTRREQMMARIYSFKNGGSLRNKEIQSRREEYHVN